MPQTAVVQNETGALRLGRRAATARRCSARSAPAAGSASDWVVLEGLKPGDTVIVDNLRAPAAGRAGPGRRKQARCRKFFIDRPVFAGVIAIIIVLAGLRRGEAAAGRAVPGDRAADGARSPPAIPGASAETLAQHRRRADRGAALRRREPDLLQLELRRPTARCSITATFEVGTDVDKAVFNVNNRVQLALPRLPDEVRRNGVIVQKRSNRHPARGRRCVSPEQHARHAVPRPTTRSSTWSTS